MEIYLFHFSAPNSLEKLIVICYRYVIILSTKIVHKKRCGTRLADSAHNNRKEHMQQTRAEVLYSSINTCWIMLDASGYFPTENT